MNSLFDAYKRKDEYLEKTKVFAVRDDKNGYPHFLIYEYDQWKYVSAKHFVPINNYI